MKFKQTLQPHTDDNTYLVKDSDKDDIDDTRKDTKEKLKKVDNARCFATRFVKLAGDTV